MVGNLADVMSQYFQHEREAHAISDHPVD
jgi:hypothetical protein